jgi:glutamate synthase (ferredoxin)
VDVKGRKSFDVVQKSIQVLLNLAHRGATGSEANSGDGAGILLQTPHEFLSEQCETSGFDLPEFGDYGVGMVFSSD